MMDFSRFSNEELKTVLKVTEMLANNSGTTDFRITEDNRMKAIAEAEVQAREFVARQKSRNSARIQRQV
jgi:hypothetical protein